MHFLFVIDLEYQNTHHRILYCIQKLQFIGKGFDVKYNMKPVNADTKYINVNGEMYQIRSEDEKDSRSFVISRFGELVCRVSANEKGEWRSDCGIGDHLLGGFVK